MKLPLSISLVLGLCYLVSCTGTSSGRMHIAQTQLSAGMDSLPPATVYADMFASINTAEHTLAALLKLDPSLSTFVLMVQQAGLTEVLSGEKPHTLFAPSNDAFSGWPHDSVSNLMKPENQAQLIRLIQNHILPGRINSASLNRKESIETSGGEYLSIATTEDSTIVGGATLVKADIQASNGVLHVVDRVLTPTEEGIANH